MFLPEAAQPWRVRLSDLDTATVLYETSGASTAGLVRSVKRYFLRIRIEVWYGADQCLVHDYDACGRDVLVQFYPHTLGDTIGWFPYAIEFQQRHHCRLTCAMFADAYPEMTFISVGSMPRI